MDNFCRAIFGKVTYKVLIKKINFQLSMEQLHEIACGSYQPSLARQYVTNLVNMTANANGPGNQDLQQFNHARSQSPVHIPCFYWDQVAPPGNWPAGQPWHPVRILVCKYIAVFFFKPRLFLNCLKSFFSEGGCQHT